MTDVDDVTLADIAARLDEAARSASAIPQLHTRLSLSQAYSVQARSLNLRYGRGERRAGLKMGFTSRAKMTQMGVDTMIWGRLTDAMRLEEGGALDLSRYIHPRIEPEIAFLIERQIDEPLSLAQARQAVAAVAPAAEIIDSRYENFKFSLTDVVADNSSSSGFVLGGWKSADTDVTNLGMVMRADGDVREIGSSAAILGNPWRSLVEAIRLASEAGEPLQEGDIVLAGAATSAIPLAGVRHLRVDVERLGRIDLFPAG